jgi:hypothetical protein
LTPYFLDYSQVPGPGPRVHCRGRGHGLPRSLYRSVPHLVACCTVLRFKLTLRCSLSACRLPPPHEAWRVHRARLEDSLLFLLVHLSRCVPFCLVLRSFLHFSCTIALSILCLLHTIFMAARSIFALLSRTRLSSFRSPSCAAILARIEDILQSTFPYSETTQPQTHWYKKTKVPKINLAERSSPKVPNRRRRAPSPPSLYLPFPFALLYNNAACFSPTRLPGRSIVLCPKYVLLLVGKERRGARERRTNPISCRLLSLFLPLRALDKVELLA